MNPISRFAHLDSPWAWLAWTGAALLLWRRFLRVVLDTAATIDALTRRRRARLQRARRARDRPMHLTGRVVPHEPIATTPTPPTTPAPPGPPEQTRSSEERAVATRGRSR